MANLASTDQIPANQIITVNWGGILGPLTGPETAQAAIINAFSGTSFNVQSVQIPFLSEIQPPVLIGSYADYDGAGHSTAGRNVLESEFEAFFLSIMGSVAGVYEVTINSVVTGAQAPQLFGALNTTTTTYVVVGVLVLVLLIFLFADFR